MKVVRLTEVDQSIYSEFVAAQPSGSFLQSWGWGEFQIGQGRKVSRFGVFNNEALIAAVQLIETKVPHMPGFYIYAPYGPVVSEDTNKEEVVAELLQFLRSEFKTAWFIRFEPKSDFKFIGKPTLHIQPGATLITDLSLNEEELLAGMHQKTRYNIKVAEKHKVEVKVGSSNDALELLIKTSNRQGYKSQSQKYFSELVEFFANQNFDCKVAVYRTEQSGECIASAIMIDFGNTRTYLFGGSENNKRNLMAPYALHWQAMRDAKSAGLTNYDWWGTETSTGATPGFVQFKLRWGGEQVSYPEPHDIVLNSKWYLAYKAFRKLNRMV